MYAYILVGIFVVVTMVWRIFQYATSETPPKELKELPDPRGRFNALYCGR